MKEIRRKNVVERNKTKELALFQKQESDKDKEIERLKKIIKIKEGRIGYLEEKVKEKKTDEILRIHNLIDYYNLPIKEIFNELSVSYTGYRKWLKPKNKKRKIW